MLTLQTLFNKRKKEKIMNHKKLKAKYPQLWEELENSFQHTITNDVKYFKKWDNNHYKEDELNVLVHNLVFLAISEFDKSLALMGMVLEGLNAHYKK